MSKLFSFSKRFLGDEKAAEVTELGIVLALIVALSVGLIVTIGTLVQGGYQSVVDALP